MNIKALKSVFEMQKVVLGISENIILINNIFYIIYCKIYFKNFQHNLVKFGFELILNTLKA